MTLMPIQKRFRLSGYLVLLLMSQACTTPPPVQDPFTWHELPQAPLATGGAFAGVLSGRIVLAGGSYFPGLPSYQGGVKIWTDSVFTLSPDASEWEQGFSLPEPRGYGASVSTGKSMLLIGGSHAGGHTREVLRLSESGAGLTMDTLPALPAPSAMHGAALLDSVVYVAGGQRDPTATTAETSFWALNLRRPNDGWRELPVWPGPGRILPAVAAQDGSIFVISGAELLPDSAGKATRRFLTDAYRYTPGKGWDRVAGVPVPVVAAPAASYGASHILVFGGDSGELFFRQRELGDRHPGFSRDVLAYHTITNTWTTIGQAPEGLVTSNIVPYRGGFVIPSGEDRPGHRSPSVWQALPVRAEAQIGLPDYIVIVLYLVVLIGIGLYFSRRGENTDDFFLAGRRIPWWAAGLSIFGTQLSALTFMAIPAKAYATDWVFALVNLGIVLIAPIVIYLYLPFFRRLNITTAYEYLEKRFNLAVRWFGSLSFILFQLGRMGIVVALPSIALSTVTSIPVTTSILIMGALATFYTVLGGIEAVIWTDVIQVVVLLGGAILSLVLVASRLDGGFGEFFEVGAAAGKFHLVNWTWDYTTAALWVVIVGNVLSNLVPYTTDQSVIQRYLTTRDEKQAARAIWTNAALTIPATILFFSVGTALFVFYAHHPQNLNPALANDAIFPWFIARQLPPGVSGIVIAGLFAAAMSSLDSSMNSVATAVVTDFYARLRPAASDRSRLRLAQGITLGVGALGTATALLIAYSEVESLWDLFLQIVGLFGGSVAGVFALGIFTRRANGAGALAGAIISAVVLYSVQRFTDVHFFLYAGIGIVTCMSSGYLISLLVPAAPRNLTGLTIYSLLQRRKDNVHVETTP